MAVGIGHLTDVTFGTSSFNPNMTSVSISGMTRTAIESSHLATATAKTFLAAGLYDGGSISIDFQFNGSDTIPLASAAETITLQPAGSTSTTDTLAFSGFVESVDIGPFESESMMNASCSVKVAGAVTGL